MDTPILAYDHLLRARLYQGALDILLAEVEDDIDAHSGPILADHLVHQGLDLLLESPLYLLLELKLFVGDLCQRVALVGE